MVSLIPVNRLPQQQQERLIYIDMRARFLGSVRRQDLVHRFGLQTASATRDLATYRAERPSNLIFKSETKSYVCSEKFFPLYPGVTAEDALRWLSPLPGETGLLDPETRQRVEASWRGGLLSTATLSVITSAVEQRRAVSFRYHSLRMGARLCAVVPHALVDCGGRWTVRAYDRATQVFRDFGLGRISEARIDEDPISLDLESAHHDTWWQQVSRVVLVPHPDNVLSAEALAQEFPLHGGEYLIEVRSAVVAYLLRAMSVDCTVRHRLGPGHIWWLKNRTELRDLPNMSLAPGFLAL